MKKIYLCLFTIFCGIICFAQKIDLKLNLEKGATYYQYTTGTTKVTQDISGEKMVIDITLGGKLSFEVNSITDSVYHCTVKYKSMRMSMNMQGQLSEFSSDAGKDDIMSRLFSGIIDQPFLVDMTDKGKIIKFQNIDPIFTNMVAQFPQLSETQKQAIIEQLKNAFGEKAFEGNFNMVMAIFPSAKVNKGDKWIVTTKLESGMAATLVTTYQLVDIGDDYYKIHGDSKMQTANKDSYVPINGMDTKYDLSGSMSSDLKISKATGWIILCKINQSMNGNVEIKDNPKIPGGITIPMIYAGEMIFTENQILDEEVQSL